MTDRSSRTSLELGPLDVAQHGGSRILGPDGRQCAICGCTSLQACRVLVDDEDGGHEEPCFWVSDDLCSSCYQDEQSAEASDAPYDDEE